MTTQTLVLAERLDPAALFGLYDAHLKAIESALGVVIVARDQRLTLEGPEAAVAKAKEVIEQLGELQLRLGEVGPDDVRFLLLQSHEGRPVEPPALHLTGRVQRLVPRSGNQSRYLKAIAENDLVVAIGPAGTGKTYLAMAAAVSAYNRKERRRIILTRPAVEAGERLGFLPGDLVEKVNPYLRPLYDALFDMMPVDAARRLLERGDIEIAPLAFMRGRTLNDAFIILDEAQNTTSEQMQMFLTRFGENSKVVVTGDVTQVDLPAGGISGLKEVEPLLTGMEGVAVIRFEDQDVIRHPLVAQIVRAYQAHREKNGRA